MGGSAEGERESEEKKKRKEQHRFVSPTRAVFAQTGLNNVLTVQVPDKLAGGDPARVWEDRCSQSATSCFSAY